jgi:hypothetical protein
MMEALWEFFSKAIKALADFAMAQLSTVAYWFCKLLGVNGIYCDPFIIRSEFFLIGGTLIIVGLIAAGWRRTSILLFILAVLSAMTLPFVAGTVSLPREPEAMIEFLLVAPLQIAAGIIAGGILIVIWTHFGSLFKSWLRKWLGLTGSKGGNGSKES